MHFYIPNRRRQTIRMPEVDHILRPYRKTLQEKTFLLWLNHRYLSGAEEESCWWSSVPSLLHLPHPHRHRDQTGGHLSALDWSLLRNSTPAQAAASRSATPLTSEREKVRKAGCEKQKGFLQQAWPWTVNYWWRGLIRLLHPKPESCQDSQETREQRVDLSAAAAAAAKAWPGGVWGHMAQIM